MLIFNRKVGDSIVINENITVTVTGIIGGIVRLGTEAPRNIHVRRGESEPRTSETEGLPVEQQDKVSMAADKDLDCSVNGLETGR